MAACSDSPVCYYLDATGGDDNNSGLAPDEAWKSLEKLRGVKLLPGNKVLLKRGEAFLMANLKSPDTVYPKIVFI